MNTNFVPRESATGYSTREGAEIIANVLRGLDTAGHHFKVYEVTGRGIYQIMATTRMGEPLGWYSDAYWKRTSRSGERAVWTHSSGARIERSQRHFPTLGWRAWRADGSTVMDPVHPEIFKWFRYSDKAKAAALEVRS